MKDGWHVLQGYDVFVEDGKIKRGTKDNGQLPAYVYRACKTGGYDREYEGVTPAAFVAGVKRGTIILT